MKKYILYLVAAIFVNMIIFSCGKDNYDTPSATLKGKVTYNGNPIGVRGSNNSVRLQLWQDGFPLKTAIDIYVTQDGSFSSSLFSGSYKLITVQGNGPWQHKTDTISVNVSGNTDLEVPVTPYFSLENIQYQLNGNILTASFKINQIDATKSIENVSLLVGKTKFVDLGYFIKREIAEGATSGNINITMDIGTELQNNSNLFARVSVKADGITEAIYDSNIFQVK